MKLGGIIRVMLKTEFTFILFRVGILVRKHYHQPCIHGDMPLTKALLFYVYRRS